MTISGSYYTIRALEQDDSQEGDEEPTPVITSPDTEILIYGMIGETIFDDGVEADDFVQALQALDANKIRVRINSEGGSVPDGISIYNALRQHKATIDVQVDGWALSIASLIAMSGDSISMPSNTLMMIHAPQAMAGGNAKELRDRADMLDQWANAMQQAYNRVANDSASVQTWLTDGNDHWFTAANAKSAGLITDIIEDSPVTAAFNAHLEHIQYIPAAAAAFITKSKEAVMPDDTQAGRKQPRPEASVTQPDPQAAAEQAVARMRKQETERRQEIRAAFQPYRSYAGVPDLEGQCLDDMEITADVARKRLLDKIGEGVEPLGSNGVIEMGTDAIEKRRQAKTEALLARMGEGDQDTANPYRGMRLSEMAKASLGEIGIDVSGQNPEEFAPKALSYRVTADGESTSDFPVILENTMHKLLLRGWDAAPLTWNKWCRTGNVSDFREWKRLVPGLIGGFDRKNESGEYPVKTFPDAELQSISAEEFGNIITIDRRVLVNDDIGYIQEMASSLGMAASRGVETHVYQVLASNPVLNDGNPLFSAAHNNLMTAGAPSVDSLVAAADLMTEQTAPGKDAQYLDLQPDVSVSRHTTRRDIQAIIEARFDPTSGTLEAPNKARGLVSETVGTPRIAGTEWYFFASQTISPVIEVVFLNGQNTPRLLQTEDFESGSLQWRPTLDYGVGAIDYRGAVKNPGA